VLAVGGTLGLAAWGFTALTRSRSKAWGEAYQFHERMRVRHLQQGLGAAKDIKVLGREDEFIAQYRTYNEGAARVGQRQSTVQQLPRLFLELLAIVGLAGAVFVLIARGSRVEVLLPTMGLCAAAAFRLMPSVNRLLGAMQGVRFSLPSVETLRHELLLLQKIDPPPATTGSPFAAELTLEHISFKYPGSDRWALDDVSMTVTCGMSTGFIGGSGAGKSTLVDIILGLLPPVTGTVCVDGSDIQMQLRGWQNQIGYVPQAIFLTDDTLRRNVALGLPDDRIDEAAVWRALHFAQLDRFVGELPDGLDTIVGERGVRLSGGQRQRIGIARALYHDPAVLVLDEATSSLDIHTERGLLKAVRALRGEKTLLIVAHRLSAVERCDRVYRLENGVVIDHGATGAVLANMRASAPL
jgi:ABC-type multidrug transport system fused ATPase/permease subunit